MLAMDDLLKHDLLRKIVFITLVALGFVGSG
jgi:hypothetical protein